MDFEDFAIAVLAITSFSVAIYLSVAGYYALV